MKFSEEFINTLRPFGRPFNDPKWSPFPGDQVVDCAGPKDTYGVIISVIDERKVLVLWSKELTLHQRTERELADQIAREIDSEIIDILKTIL